MNTLFTLFRRQTHEDWNVVGIFIFALVLLTMGVVLFIEDTVAGYVGVQLWVFHLELPPAGHWAAYLVVGLIPQVGQLLYLAAMITNPRRNPLAWLGVVLFLVIDLAIDSFGRANGNLDRLPIAVAMNLVYFTFASELLIVVGGMVVWTVRKRLRRLYQAS